MLVTMPAPRGIVKGRQSKVQALLSPLEWNTLVLNSPANCLWATGSGLGQLKSERCEITVALISPVNHVLSYLGRGMYRLSRVKYKVTLKTLVEALSPKRPRTFWHALRLSSRLSDLTNAESLRPLNLRWFYGRPNASLSADMNALTPAKVEWIKRSSSGP